MEPAAQVPLPQPPIARRRPKVLEAHADRRVDPYYWLREKDNPVGIAYLEAENAYTDAVMAPTAPLQEKLYRETVGRVQETDTSAPVFHRGWWTYTRTVEGLDYEIYCRRPGSMEAAEQALLDGNELAKGHKYFDLGYADRSPDESLLAYAVDFDGSERLVLQEDDEHYELNVELTKSERYIVFSSASQVTGECRFLRSDAPDGQPQIVEPRRHGIEYSVEDQEDRFLILTNDGARDFRLMSAPVSSPSRASWTEVVPERPGVRLNAVDVHIRHVVLGQRSDGLQRLEVLDSATGGLHVVGQPDPTYTAFPGSSPVYDSQVMRFFYTSLTAPFSAVDYDMRTKERTVVKEQPVRGGYNRADYVTERQWAIAPDGVRVPISIVYRRGLEHHGANPALLNGYGACELSRDPMFDPARLSLLDRGLVFAIAHVRGGGEMGRGGYEEGRFLHKTNTFTDFIACAERLVKLGLTTPERLAIRGRSAGGLLIGAVLNMRPDLFACAVAQVPFVDALTTMLDDKLPLTINEFEEWGNPAELDFYRYMKAYSPYDNVHPDLYPALLVTAGLNDPRVSYWEPAKWVAKLRSSGQSERTLLLKTQMGSGHSGPSGRYESWREEAFVSAFVIDQIAS